VRGRTRYVGSYRAQRGWFDRRIQEVINDWKPKLDFDIILNTFEGIWRLAEQGAGCFEPKIYTRDHLRFVCALAQALEKLHAPESEAGWVIRLYGDSKCGPRLSACEVRGLRPLIKQLVDGSDPVSKHLRQQMPTATLNTLTSANGLRLSEEELVRRVLAKLVRFLNDVIYEGRLNEEDRFANVNLRKETQDLIKQTNSGVLIFHKLPAFVKGRLSAEEINACEDAERGVQQTKLNRMLLEDRYSTELTRMEFQGMPLQGRRPRSFTYAEMVVEILVRGGPAFTAGSLEKTAKRLKLTRKSSAYQYL
jgi:hypothetical protein